ncbi:MAG TPA: response regulator transcription factor [Gemmatimonadaceae bacterium]|nr:response regulator transcription factor [Gemmatimonadaceae bacterium]
MTSILLVEDNAPLAQGLKSNLEFEGYEVVLAATAQEALAALTPESASPNGAVFDLILLDLMLPDADGYRVLRSLRESGDGTPVLVLTALGEEADKVRGFRFGADDYVTKPFGLLELLARVDALLRRSRRAGQDKDGIVTFGEVRVDLHARTATRRGRPLALRPKEFELFAALVRREGKVATRNELLREVWGYDPAVVSRTVDTHIAELRRKLERDAAHPEHIVTVLKTGYRFSRRPEPTAGAPVSDDA